MALPPVREVKYVTAVPLVVEVYQASVYLVFLLATSLSPGMKSREKSWVTANRPSTPLLLEF